MLSNLPRDEATFYRTQSAFTDPGTMGHEMLNGLPTDPGALARVVRGLLIHRLEGDRFGVRLEVQRLHHDAETRYVDDILRTIRERSEAPVAERRDPADRFVGTCRDFVVLHVALLRHVGIPARARAGTSTYFSPQHWVTECWDPTRGWKLIDPQLTFEAGEEEDYRFSFDPYDIPWSTFRSGGMGWRKARSTNEALNWHIVVGDVLLDLAALNKVEMLPWDIWGPMDRGANDEPDTGTTALLDAVASATGPSTGRLSELRRYFFVDGQIRTPATVASWTTYLGNRLVALRT